MDPPASSTNTHSPPLHVPPPKGAHGNGISQDPNFSLTNFPPTYDSTASPTKPIPIPPPRDAIPVPPPNAQPKGHAQSPPAPGSAGSCVTDESDDSLVHIRLPGGNATRSHHRSDSLSLTQSNLQHHNDLSSGMVSSMRDYGLSSNRKRLRGKELATHSKDTLIQMLIRQEHQSDEGRKLLRNALDKLEQYKLDLLEANNHCRRLERACQKLTDERMLMHTQVTEAVGKAQQQALAAQQELSIYKLRLEHAEQALCVSFSPLCDLSLIILTSFSGQTQTQTYERRDSNVKQPELKQNLHATKHAESEKRATCVRRANKVESRVSKKAYRKDASSVSPKPGAPLLDRSPRLVSRLTQMWLIPLPTPWI